MESYTDEQIVLLHVYSKYSDTFPQHILSWTLDFHLIANISKTAVLVANIVIPDRMPHSVMSDKGLNHLIRRVYTII